MPIFKAVVLASLLWISDVNAFAPTRRPVFGQSVGNGNSVGPVHQYDSTVKTSSSLFMAAATQATRDLYHVLGVTRNAGAAEIRQAFRTMAKRYHPDSNPDAGAVDLFQEVNRAYEVLRNPQLRQNYDMYGFDGIGTSASSDAEEMEYYSNNRQRGGTMPHGGMPSDQTRSRFRTEFYGNQSVDNTKYTCDQQQNKQPFRGGCFVDVDGIGSGQTSNGFFGRGASARSGGRQQARRGGANPRTPQGGKFSDVEQNIGMGASTHSFFSDVDNNGRPKGARANKSTPHQSGPQVVAADDFFKQNRGTFQNGIFEVTEPTTQSVFGKKVDSGFGPRTVQSDQTKARFQNHGVQAEVQPPPHAAAASTSRDAFFSGTAATPNQSNPAQPYAPSSPFVGGNAAAGAAQAGVPTIGADVQVELAVDFSMAMFGGDKKMLYHRLGRCYECSGHGCPRCSGQGLKKMTKEIKVTIPAGSKNGSVIKIPGEGDVGTYGGPSGDLLVFLRAETEKNPADFTAATTKTTPTAPQQQEYRQVDIPKDLNAEEQALLDRLQYMLEMRKQQQQQQQQNGMWP